MKSPRTNLAKTILITTGLVATVFLPVQVSAQAGPGTNRGPIPFEIFDADGDGAVSEEEFNQALADRMAANAAEGRAMKNAANMPQFEVIDTDQNGTLSETEILVFQAQQRSAMQGQGPGQGMNRGMAMPSFSDLDTDGDGCINAEEFQAHQQAMHPERF